MPTFSHNTAHGSYKREHTIYAFMPPVYRDQVDFQTLCNPMGVPLAAAAVPPFSCASGVSCTGVPVLTTAAQEQLPAH